MLGGGEEIQNVLAECAQDEAIELDGVVRSEDQELLGVAGLVEFEFEFDYAAAHRGTARGYAVALH